MASNGTGYQFLWDGFPWFNTIAGHLFRFLLIEFALLYSASFLDIKRKDKAFYIFAFLMLVRAGIFCADLLTDFQSDIYDACILLITYLIGLKKLRSGYKPARFFVVGFSILFIGFFLHYFMSVDTELGFFLTILYVYSIQFSAVIEMMFFPPALSDKVRTLAREKDEMKDRLNKELEEKVKERTKELNTFVYRVSHDLKGSLNSITGLTKLALKDASNAIEYFEHIGKTSSRLQGIVSEFLSISKAREGKLSLEKIDFKILTETVINSLKELEYFKNSTISIHINQEYVFHSDPALISSLIQNVFENALKYKREGENKHFVKLGIHVNAQESIIRVQDNGRGIRKESRQKVFEMFHRESVDTNGSGLGLYIVKSTVEKLNGKIKLESEEGKGTTITITLPNTSGGVTRVNKAFEIDFSEMK
jgi:signal transduction histidine kinase